MAGHKGRAPQWMNPDKFARDYCARCEFGWNRTGAEGALMVCLLDREPVLQGMTDCDRFEARIMPKIPT